MWQSELPGVGPTYQVSRTMLRGVAICSGDIHTDEEHNVDLGYHTSASSGRKWHYFPVESMSMDAQKCFDALFQIKHRYTMEELEPYLQHLIDTLPSHDTNNDHSSSNTSSSSAAVTELLLRYTKLITEVGLDGTTRTFYVKR
jgi:Sister chromatid cohesion protein Dcc1